jgi:hypothetical protein
MEKLFVNLSSATLNADVRYVASDYCFCPSGTNPPLLHKPAPNQRGFFSKKVAN